ncbi:MAG: SMC-Scp complex subunit ScpB [Myxococcales bacterium]|jgi:segregation and condensation protein B|nr:SMC-Scp complex subunit ScpB [Myxococcales bacterium]
MTDPIDAENANAKPEGSDDNVLPFAARQEQDQIEGDAEAFADEGSESDSDEEETVAAEIDTPAEPAESEDAFDKLVAEAKNYAPERIRRLIESILFISDKPLTEELIRKNTGIELKVIREALADLQSRYAEGCSGIVLHDVAGGWQFRTSPESAEVIRRFLKVKPQRLTRAALETLAIVAYRQPVTRPEIEDIRAVDSGAVLKALLERRLIKILGKREEAGRPLIYGTTREFLEFFNLRDLGALPTLREFQELSKESEEVLEKELGPEAVAEPKGVASLVQDLRDDSFEAKLKESSAEADAALADLEQALTD